MALVHTSVDAGVAVLTIDDPDRRNALSTAMVDELVAAVDDLEGRDDVGALVVTGAGPSFCAGADLSQLGRSRREGLTHIYSGFLRVAGCALPTVAAVNGPAVGAGLNLALACDVRLAGRSARFDTRFLQLGIHPGGGHTWLLQRAVGPQAARAMVLFGAVLDGEEAAAAGLAWRTVADDELLGAATALASQAAAVPRELAVRTKATMDDVLALDDHADAVARELETQLWSMDTPEFAERLAALQRRITKENR